MPVIVLFGFPGAGKTYLGKILEKYFDYYFYEGDLSLTKEMKAAIKKQTVFTNEMRNVFFKKLINKIQSLRLKYKKLVIAQTFIKEKYRMDLFKKIPEVKFIFIKTKKSVREKRLGQRRDYPLEKKYAQVMCKNFDKPDIKHYIINNNINGEAEIKKQIRQFFLQSQL